MTESLLQRVKFTYFHVVKELTKDVKNLFHSHAYMKSPNSADQQISAMYILQSHPVS